MRHFSNFLEKKRIFFFLFFVDLFKIKSCYVHLRLSGMSKMTNSTPMNCTELHPSLKQDLAVDDVLNIVFYTLIFSVGSVGNALVLYVILRYSKMKTVTNIYIFNLSVADLIFLCGMPFIICMFVKDQWIFGDVVCYLYYFTQNVNQFTGAFTLLVMAADRFLAVCYPIKSMGWRTLSRAYLALTVIWISSIGALAPIIFYVKVETNIENCTYSTSCGVDAPIFGKYILITLKKSCNFTF